LCAGIAVAAAYLGWTFLSRRQATARMERAIEAQRSSESSMPAEKTGSGVKITQFYAKSAEITAAERNLICYGVRNARSVRMEPPVESLTPSLSRCFPVEPKRDTTYTLIAEGFDGSRDSASFQISVKPAPPHIEFVTVSAGTVRLGESVTVCYGVDHSKVVRLDPIGLALPAAAKHCTLFYPKATRAYTLVALDGEGRRDSEKFSIQVK
jgi:hypothetical protein